jgi:hypothetical protein
VRNLLARLRATLTLPALPAEREIHDLTLALHALAVR